MIAPPTAPATAAPSTARGGGAAGSGSLPGQAALRIAPDEAGTGTNALYVRPPGWLGFAFGDASCTRHLAQARALGVSVHRVERPGLKFDLDTPADLERYERSRRERLHGECES